jgi:hypothetical protein
MCKFDRDNQLQHQENQVKHYLHDLREKMILDEILEERTRGFVHLRFLEVRTAYHQCLCSGELRCIGQHTRNGKRNALIVHPWIRKPTQHRRITMQTPKGDPKTIGSTRM